MRAALQEESPCSASAALLFALLFLADITMGTVLPVTKLSCRENARTSTAVAPQRGA